MPSYLCNYSCEYCYLGDLRRDDKLLDLDVLEDRLNELSSWRIISELVVYGGEISLLDLGYFDKMCCVLNRHCKPSFVTNLSNSWIVDYSDENDYELSISLNQERPFYHETLDKIRNLRRLDNKSISTVVTPAILNQDIGDLVELYNGLGLDVLFIEYHPSVNSTVRYDVTIEDYSKFLVSILKHPNRKFNLINERILKSSDWNPCKSGFIFINPGGKYCSVDYDCNGVERPIEYGSLDEWKLDCNVEYSRYFRNCSLCEYFTKCKAEHLVVMGKRNCSGLYGVMKAMETLN